MFPRIGYTGGVEIRAANRTKREERRLARRAERLEASAPLRAKISSKIKLRDGVARAQLSGNVASLGRGHFTLKERG